MTEQNANDLTCPEAWTRRQINIVTPDTVSQSGANFLARYLGSSGPHDLAPLWYKSTYSAGYVTIIVGISCRCEGRRLFFLANIMWTVKNSYLLFRFVLGHDKPDSWFHGYRKSCE